MTRIEPGTFYRNGKKYIALSKAAQLLGLHPFDFYDAEKYGGLPLVTVSGCKCIAEDDLGKMKGAK